MVKKKAGFGKQSFESHIKEYVTREAQRRGIK